MEKWGLLNITPLSHRSFTALHSHWGMVVIKLAAELKHRTCLKQEADFLNSYTNGYWPEFCDYLTYKGIDYLVVKKIEGAPLSAAMSIQNFQFSWVKSIERALCAVHHTGYIHADIKPSNILITNSNEPRVIDFGSIRKIGENLSGVRFASYSPSFASPNISESKGLASPIDDWFSLGVTLDKCITAHRESVQTAKSGHSSSPTPLQLPSHYSVIMNRIQKSG
ncbi:hypothetical protein EK599_14660 [Vibrio sp. T187]|uniref:protein kinase domain-containing protein n=1 Tax=Vibrio TaxID=662 RepID=UPI0010CA06D0|nr:MULTISPECIES: AarF/UbiB family protein [Vibrio]MBW3696939.1 hypothetical protein [Vibrio sp. T187]